MAGGYNKSFRNNPQRFLRNSEIRIGGHPPPDDGRQPVDLVAAGMGGRRRNINIIRWVDRPGRQWVDRPGHRPGRFFPGPAPVVAYCLSARQDRPDAANRALAPTVPLAALVASQGMVDLGANADYFFTAEMSGCMLAVYGPAATPRVEHMNYQGPAGMAAQRAVYQARLGLIQNVYPAARILARTDTCLPAALAGVTYYNDMTWVIGVSVGGVWQFYYRSRMEGFDHQL